MVKLSIIIAYYNTYELTKNLLDVLVPQLTEETELFLMDDGCNETRLDVYKDKIYIEHLEKNGGATIAMNKAIRKASGKYIAIIDSDDMVDKEYISTLIDAINNHEEDIIYFDWQDMNTGEIVHHPHNYAPWKAIYKRARMPLFREGWRYSYDVPFQEDLHNLRLSEYFIDKILYYYNSNRVGNLSWKKEQIRRKEMVKVEAVKDFTLGRFDELKNIERKNKNHNANGMLYVGDKFECPQELARYLFGENDKKQVVIKIIEVIPEPDEKVLENIKEVPVEKKPVLEIGKPRKAKIKKNK